MTAYLVIEARIHDRERFATYARATPPLVARHGGRYIVLGGQQSPLEGDWTGARVVISAWPDAAAARRFWDSPEYAEARRLREGTGEFRVLLVDGTDTTSLA